MKRLWAFIPVVLLALTGSALAQTASPASLAAPAAMSSDPFLAIETYRLWPGRAEGATSDEADQTPTLTVFWPQPTRDARTLKCLKRAVCQLGGPSCAELPPSETRRVTASSELVPHLPADGDAFMALR